MVAKLKFWYLEEAIKLICLMLLLGGCSQQQRFERLVEGTVKQTLYPDCEFNGGRITKTIAVYSVPMNVPYIRSAYYNYRYFKGIVLLRKNLIALDYSSKAELNEALIETAKRKKIFDLLAAKHHKRILYYVVLYTYKADTETKVDTFITNTAFNVISKYQKPVDKYRLP